GDAAQVAQLPAVAVLFAAFLGYNPVQQLLGPTLTHLPPDQAGFLTGRSFFPSLITQPFSDGLHVAFWFAIIACVVAAGASWFGGSRSAGSPARSDGGGLDAALQAELPQNVGDVHARRLGADEQLGSDLGVGQAPANQLQNLRFPRG